MPTDRAPRSPKRVVLTDANLRLLHHPVPLLDIAPDRAAETLGWPPYRIDALGRETFLHLLRLQGLLDAFVPAWEEFAKVTREGGSAGDAIRAASVVARQKTEEIKPWVAKRGRAAYTGERSCGTYDAGSVAVAMMAEQLAEAWTRSSTVAERGV